MLGLGHRRGHRPARPAGRAAAAAAPAGSRPRLHRHRRRPRGRVAVRRVTRAARPRARPPARSCERMEDALASSPRAERRRLPRSRPGTWSHLPAPTPRTAPTARCATALRRPAAPAGRGAPTGARSADVVDDAAVGRRAPDARCGRPRRRPADQHRARPPLGPPPGAARARRRAAPRGRSAVSARTCGRCRRGAAVAGVARAARASWTIRSSARTASGATLRAVRGTLGGVVVDRGPEVAAPARSRVSRGERPSGHGTPRSMRGGAQLGPRLLGAAGQAALAARAAQARGAAAGAASEHRGRRGAADQRAPAGSRPGVATGAGRRPTRWAAGAALAPRSGRRWSLG